jgi:hypothetical protein
MIGTIALIGLVTLGIVLMTMPEKLIREDMRDDPNAVEMTKKTGKAMLGFAVMAALLMLKYKLF